MITHLHTNETTRTQDVVGASSDMIILPEVEDLPWDRSDELGARVKMRNDAVSRIAPDAARRFGLLPFPLLDESLDETERVFGELGLDGVCIVPIVGEKTLDDGVYTPLIDEIDRRGAQLLLHPVDTSGVPLANPRYLDSVLAYARLLYFDRIRSMSKTRIILTHTCGIESFLAENIGMLHYLQAKRWRMGSFLFDYLIRKRLQGFELVRNVRSCA